MSKRPAKKKSKAKKAHAADCPECEVCCALGICCPPSDVQKADLALAMATAVGLDDTQAHAASAWVFDHLHSKFSAALAAKKAQS